MSVFHPYTMKCTCGSSLSVNLADSINIKRSPESRDAILKGKLHRVTCPQCSRQMTTEKPFNYVDLSRNSFFKVLPRGERHRWKKESQALDTIVALVPETLGKPSSRELRVLFGMDELREKLVAQDAGIDDRVVELLKVLLVYEHPMLLQKARLRLILDQVTEEVFEFTAAYEHNHQQFRVELPRWIVTDLVEHTDQLQEWTQKAHPNGNLFKLEDHWVNMWRWSPQPSALEKLQGYAESIRDGQIIDVNQSEFQQMLDQIPRGNHLPSWAKRDLRTLFEFAKTHNFQSLQDKLFEIRFGIILEDDWSTNQDIDDIDTLWKLLRDLPDTNVEGNTKIREILLEEGEGGGWYSPSTYDIAIGSDELSNQERFEDVMRHEVGHAVHEMQSGLVNTWLESEFGWRIFGTSDIEIDQWVNLMGGWGTLTRSQIGEVRQYLRTALGRGGSWVPGPTPNPPARHPWYQSDFAPRLVFEKTGANWYQNFSTWHRVGSHAFFLNYWYQTFMVVDKSSLDLVAMMPSNYASMSHFEFFAELYALYYDLNDPQRPVINSSITQWFDKNIGTPTLGNPQLSQSRQKKKNWETTKRPKQRTKRKKL